MKTSRISLPFFNLHLIALALASSACQVAGVSVRSAGQVVEQSSTALAISVPQANQNWNLGVANVVSGVCDPEGSAVQVSILAANGAGNSLLSASANCGVDGTYSVTLKLASLSAGNKMLKVAQTGPASKSSALNFATQSLVLTGMSAGTTSAPGGTTGGTSTGGTTTGGTTTGGTTTGGTTTGGTTGGTTTGGTTGGTTSNCPRPAGVKQGTKIVFGPACLPFESGVGGGPFDDANEFALYRATNVSALRSWLTFAGEPYPADASDWRHIKTQARNMARDIIKNTQNGIKNVVTVSFSANNGFFEPPLATRQQVMKRAYLDIIDTMNVEFKAVGLTFPQVVNELNLGNELGYEHYWPVNGDLRSRIHYLRDFFGPGKAALAERGLSGVRVTAGSTWCPNTYPGRRETQQIMDDVRSAMDPSRDINGHPAAFAKASDTYPASKSTVALEFARSNYLPDGFDCHSYNRKNAADIIADFKAARTAVSTLRYDLRKRGGSLTNYQPSLISSEWSCKDADKPSQCLREVYTVNGGLPGVLDASFPFIWRWCVDYGPKSSKVECRTRSSEFDIRDVPALRDAFREGVNDAKREFAVPSP